MTDQQQAQQALPPALRADVVLTCQVASAMGTAPSAALAAAAALVVAYRAREAQGNG